MAYRRQFRSAATRHLRPQPQFAPDGPVQQRGETVAARVALLDVHRRQRQRIGQRPNEYGK
jgi:hypothetical protein